MRKILKFYSPTCGPCKSLGNALDQLKDAEVIPIDVTDSDNKELIEEYNVKTIPTVVILKGEEKPIIFRGAVSINKIKEEL